MTARIAQLISPLILRQQTALGEVTRAIEEYFQGSRRRADLPINPAPTGVF